MPARSSICRDRTARLPPVAGLPVARLHVALPNLAVLDQAAPLRGAGPGVSGVLCLGGPPAARRATPLGAEIKQALSP